MKRVIKDDCLYPYHIICEDSQFTIIIMVTPKEHHKPQYEETRGHYTSLGGAINKIVQLQTLTRKKVSDLSQYTQDLRDISSTITKALHDAGVEA